MALWKEPPKSTSSSASNVARFEKPETATATGAPVGASHAGEPGVAPARPIAESLIAPDLVIEGKIEGSGHVRIGGKFKGDINVRGDVTIEQGAKVDGSLHAERITIAGELVGNIDSATHVELLQSGALTGDVKSATFSVAKGSKMRGQVEFGWQGGKAVSQEVRKDTDIGIGSGLGK